MCKLTGNAGMGPPLENAEGVLSNTRWYATNQFAVDVIFNNRMKQYDCLTKDSSIAAAVFVPFYASFDIARYLWGYNISHRDAASLELVYWLVKRPDWSVMSGKDHFLVLEGSLGISEAKDEDVFVWQNRMRKLERKYLFSFAGAPCPDNPKSIRGQVIDQCRSSMVCKLLECDFGESKCQSPSSIMRMFHSSLFCLLPQGDSYTRRSAFVGRLHSFFFFHPGSAYIQYVLLGDGQRTVGAHEWDPFFSKPKDANGDSGSSSTEAAQNSWRNEQMSET
ncbi:hypothetical protein ZIOFF_019605 [Zingiber officinale]|uniref:Exostosin GT47 domain-containing protein n=1 Tax=Zingiber officinale TaxID=94328 RepID=A0A8J5LT67_ZINOF|nr:hypothetical protein ZIOFF_019605 [Zingiber officinale]